MPIENIADCRRSDSRLLVEARFIYVELFPTPPACWQRHGLRQDPANGHRQQVCRSSRMCMAHSGLLIFGGFVGGLAALIFTGQQEEPAKKFLLCLLIFVTAVTQLWINQPKTLGATPALR